MTHLRSLEPKHYVLIAAFLAAAGAHLGTHATWAEAFTPASVGALLVQGGAFLGALYSPKPGAPASTQRR